MADNFDLGGLLSPDMATDDQKRQAMAKALLGRAQQPPADLIFSMGSNPVTRQYGQAALGAQQHQTQAGIQALSQARQLQSLQNEQDYRTKELQQGQERIDQGRYTHFQDQGGNIYRQNSKSGQVELVQKAAAGGTGPLMKPADVQKGFDEFQKELSSSGKANINADRQKRVDAAERLEKLVTNGQGIQNLTPQQVKEASASLANLINQGVVSERLIDDLTPDTLAGKWANLKQKVMNQPEGADAQAFLQNMMDTAKREVGVTREQMKKTMLDYIPRRWNLRKYDQGTFDSMLSQHNFNPSQFDEGGRIKESASAPAGITHVRKDPATGETRGWNGKAWVPMGAQ